LNFNQKEQLDRLVETAALMALFLSDPRPELKKQIHDKLMLNAFPEKIKNELSDVFAKYVKEIEL
jgi:hypothetical protein